MMIIPMLLAALFVVGLALFGIISSGSDAEPSRIPRQLPRDADAFAAASQLLDAADPSRRLASGNMEMPSQAFVSGSMEMPSQAPARVRPRLPSLVRTGPLPVFGPVHRRPPLPQRRPSGTFSDES